MKKLIRITLFLLAIFGWNDLCLNIITCPHGIYYARHNDDYTVLVRRKV